MAAPLSLSTIKDSIEQRANEFVLAYETATKTKDANTLSIHLSPDCRRFLASRAFLEAVNQPPGFSLSNAEYQAQYEHVMPIWSINATEISNFTIDPERRKAAARTISHGEFSDGEKYQVEFAWFLDFNDEGTEITGIVQYVDPTESLLFRTKAKELHDKKEAEKAIAS